MDMTAFLIYIKLQEKLISRKAAYKQLRNLGIQDPLFFVEGVKEILALRERCKDLTSPRREEVSKKIDRFGKKFWGECHHGGTYPLLMASLQRIYCDLEG